MDGATIIIIAVFIYVQDLFHGIHLVIVLLGYVRYCVHKIIMPINLLEHDNVNLYVQVLMMLLVMLQVYMIHLVIMIQIDASNIV